jgi:hypothetical protein
MELPFKAPKESCAIQTSVRASPNAFIRVHGSITAHRTAFSPVSLRLGKGLLDRLMALEPIAKVPK